MEQEFSQQYKSGQCFPVRIGDVLQSTYRVVAKLGFGTSSIVWLGRNTKTNVYYALKVCAAGAEQSNEVLVSERIKSIESDHPGLARLCVVVDNFKVQGPSGTHQCLVFDPLGVTYTQLRARLPGKVLEKRLLQQSLLLVLLGLDVLHKAGVVHTDISPNNILLGVDDPAIFQAMERSAQEDHDTEIHRPGDRFEHQSQELPVTGGAPVIADFGAAHVGEPGQQFTGDIMPNFHRAPEVILNMPWDCKVDIWSIGVMIWDLFEGKRLFYAARDGKLDDEQHLAEMVSLMGPPPKRFLQRSASCNRYWDSEGNWIAATEIPEQSFDSRETRLEGEDHALLVALAKKILRWLPEERPPAEELFEDSFLTQYLRES
ncbi:unnamed protein product [Zymoseptoria tritici ST99CH_3D1]|nr:unnamed protein product [Zymoseptoria tritici ST99CH_3D1]